MSEFKKDCVEGGTPSDVAKDPETVNNGKGILAQLNGMRSGVLAASLLAVLGIANCSGADAKRAPSRDPLLNQARELAIDQGGAIRATDKFRDFDSRFYAFCQEAGDADPGNPEVARDLLHRFLEFKTEFTRLKADIDPIVARGTCGAAYLAAAGVIQSMQAREADMPMIEDLLRTTF